MTRFLPGFKRTCLIVGLLFVLLSLSLFGKGLMISMAEFKVPENVLLSEHYYDAIFWVYTHMLIIGLLILAMGYSVTDNEKQKWITLLLFVVSVYYTFLDFRSSDSVLGNGLYQGDASLFLAIISLIVSLLFLLVSIRLFRSR